MGHVGWNAQHLALGDQDLPAFDLKLESSFENVGDLLSAVASQECSGTIPPLAMKTCAMPWRFFLTSEMILRAMVGLRTSFSISSHV